MKNNNLKKYLKCNQLLINYLNDNNFLNFKHLHGKSIDVFTSQILSNPNINYPANIINEAFENYICPECTSKISLINLIDGLSGKHALNIQRYFWNYLK